MKLEILAVKDVKAGKMCQPYFVPNVEIGKRMLKATVNTKDKNSNLYLFPEDFQLFKIGTFNEEDGSIESNVEFLANVTEFIDNKIKQKTEEEGENE